MRLTGGAPLTVTTSMAHFHGPVPKFPTLRLLNLKAFALSMPLEVLGLISELRFHDPPRPGFPHHPLLPCLRVANCLFGSGSLARCSKLSINVFAATANFTVGLLLNSLEISTQITRTT